MSALRTLQLAALALLSPILAAGAQEVQSRAMTREEIERELGKDAPVRGQLLHAGKLLCNLDSTSGMPMELQATKPRSWLRVDPNPRFTLRLRSKNDVSRVHVIRGGPADSIAVLVNAVPGGAPTYQLQFGSPLPDGDYEFAVSQGNMLLYPSCGFTVRRSDP